MATSQTKDAPLQSTRQLLDELDALMARMLALPIEEQESVDGPALPTTVAATLTLVDPATEEPLLESVSGTTAMVSETTTPQDFQEAITSSPELQSVDYVLTPEPRVPLLSEVAAPSKEELLPLPPRIWARPSLGFQFVCWVNRRYHRSTLWLGRRGRFLRTRTFRVLLGLAGLAMLLLAFGWLAWDWLDWKQ